MNTKLLPLVYTALNEIETLRRAHDAPVLVAIDGRSGSGKSSLAGIIKTRTDGSLVSGDDFYAGGSAIHSQLSAAKLADICLDRTRLRSVMQRLRSGSDAQFHPYDWIAFNGRLSDEEKTVKSSAVLIVEGVYTFHPELRDLVDLSILISSPDETRFQRLASREGKLSGWEHQWHRAEVWYFENLSPPDIFDLQILNV